MFRARQFYLAIFLVLAVVPTKAQGTTGSHQTAQSAVPAMPDDTVKKSATADPNYVIGAQDVLDINVWKEPDVSRIVPVRPDGKISLPLLNDVQAAGLTPAQLAAQVTESLKKYVTSPQVTVIVTTINSQRVYILGEVTRPGAFPLLPGMSVLQALSSAGGFTQFAKVKSIFVRRIENGKEAKYPFNYREVINGKRPEQDILLKAGDTIVVP
ncbi:MAG TPA: polysaccharide biosynthesis/export family protein [Candidatus Acidoferrum sp.]|nr:polysaccharide biosynthesis/export family protein [Candidatus Acidoferrum sp.]